MISASFSLSLPRLGWKSTSTPRSLKICTAAGDSASEMRTLGAGMAGPVRSFRRRGVVPEQRKGFCGRVRAGGPDSFGNGASGRLGELRLFLGEGPVEPRRQSLEVGGLDGGAAPDAQPRRSIPVGADV